MSRRHSLPLAALAAALFAVVSAGPASGLSCLPVDMQLKELEPGNVVFVGTVTARDVAGARVRVDQWFRGADPRDSLAIPIAGAMPGEPIIIGSWDPTPGQVWFIIGNRLAADVVESDLCRQMPVDAALMATATSLFGPPQLPPFEDPDVTDGETPSGMPLVIAAGVVALGLLGGLGAVFLLQRRAG